MSPRVTEWWLKHPRRWILGLLAGGVILGVGTPLYLGYVEPSVAGYLLHPVILIGQALPYVLCGVLWLPSRSRETTLAAVIVSGLLLLSGVILYGPILWTAGAHGGDMIGLTFLAVSLGLTAVLLLGSAVAWLVLRLQRG